MFVYLLFHDQNSTMRVILQRARSLFNTFGFNTQPSKNDPDSIFKFFVTPEFIYTSRHLTLIFSQGCWLCTDTMDISLMCHKTKALSQTRNEHWYLTSIFIQGFWLHTVLHRWCNIRLRPYPKLGINIKKWLFLFRHHEICMW